MSTYIDFQSEIFDSIRGVARGGWRGKYGRPHNTSCKWPLTIGATWGSDGNAEWGRSHGACTYHVTPPLATLLDLTVILAF